MVMRSKAVNTSGKGFQFYCLKYQEDRESGKLKPLL